MDDKYNTAPPLVMHIDLNSCFATIEQQARPMLRGKPVAVVNRRADNAVIVTASYEAKAYGVKTGMKLGEAKRLCRGLIGVETDPPKYRHVYHRLLAIMQDYSASVTMKSIDEGVIDFSGSTGDMLDRSLEEIGYEIKNRLKGEIGVWMRCNIGIGNNRFLAKTAAGLHKPDGLDVLTSHNIREVFSGMKLQDLTGIAVQNERRLNSVGIYTPIAMLESSAEVLHMGFRSIHGEQWFKRLRGWEVDDIIYDMKSCGRQYVLDSRNLSRPEIMQRLHNLVEGVGSKLRRSGKVARGVSLYTHNFPKGSWRARQLSPLPFFSDQAIWQIAKRLFEGAPDNIIMIGVSCDYLQDDETDQLSIFGDEIARERRMVTAVDEVNLRYGERTIYSADTVETNAYMRAKIPFGSTRHL